MNATTPAPYAPPPFRRIACARCGASFDCGGPACWCADESYRLPMPLDAASTCLCPACLRAKAQAGQATRA
jgi:hypothetical protein